MTPEEREAISELCHTVEFLIIDLEYQSDKRSNRYHAIKVVREHLQEAYDAFSALTHQRLSTILTSQPNRDGRRVVVRQQDNRSLDDQLRFMTEIEDVESGHFYQGHYLMTMDKAYEDFLERCEREECKI